jgi:hypothetical protein
MNEEAFARLKDWATPVTGEEHLRSPGVMRLLFMVATGMSKSCGRSGDLAAKNLILSSSMRLERCQA